MKNTDRPRELTARIGLSLVESDIVVVEESETVIPLRNEVWNKEV